ncbi:hypothetical protein [Aurantiacibacter poecillastricola]|uniref:hypothetical protein n=1 Tax=Aurantiacibacter poecillastricola TaxID=3064385 RepID=UPI00273D8588|nr:hypothetical protein [Aurantiacibacter sp. 219JJ12-13]MDP5260213.1 hypothetical protein [Aurantiacibacter sp. 219JJ12-13]
MNYRNALMLGFMAVALQGCIAAAAVPIVTGAGGLLRSSVSDDARSDRRDRDERVLTGEMRDPAPPASAPAENDLAAAAPAPSPAAASEPEATPVTQPAELAATERSSAAAEAAAAAAGPMARPAPPSAGYGALRSYTLATLDGGLPLPSAMLDDPTSLQPERRQCQGNAPTLVIDIDPAGGLVPLAGPLAVNNELARVLADLRMRDVQIAWITDRGPVDARAIRDRLVAAGLDPKGEDALYVERYPGETRQARRTALAQNQCIIAVAGDERADFDDLYNFVINPEDASDLEPLMGNGWFLIDNPVGG